MLVTADQIICHLIGDFFLQSDWQALNKYDKKWVALLHSTLYSLPFLFLTQSWLALIVICLSHAIIDHYKIAAYISWLKNWIGLVRPKSWQECKLTGNDPNRPYWITVWLGIIMDNTIHIIINALAIVYL